MSSLENSIELAQGRRRAAGASRALPAWWFGRLAALLQTLLPGGKSKNRLLASLEGDALLLTRETGRGKPPRMQRLAGAEAADPSRIAAALKSLKAEGLPVAAQLDATACLCRKITLPRASEENLHAVLTHQIDRLTPWPPGEAAFDALTLGYEEENRKVALLLAAAPRSAVKQLVKSLEALGLSVTSVVPSPREGLISPSQATRLNLLPHGETDPKGGRRLLSLILSLLICASLGAVGWWGWNAHSFRQERLSAEPQLLELRRSTASLLEERAALIALRNERSYLFEKKLNAPSALYLLEVLSKLLPDGVWLTGLKLDGDKAVLSGLATDASALLPLLEGSQLFEEAAFAASTRRDEESGKERFQISLSVKPPPLAAEGGKP